MAFSDEFSSMQEDALRRVREMQKRSRSMVSPEGEPHAPEQSSEKEKKPAQPSILGELGRFKIDEEKALIGMLIYILYKQGADVKLLLALGYLLL